MKTLIKVVDHYLKVNEELGNINHTVRYHSSPIRSSEIGAMQFRKVKEEDLREYCSKRLLSVSAATVDGELRLIRRALEHALGGTRARPARNPAQNVRIVADKRQPPTITRDQFKCILAALAKKPAIRALVDLAVETKMRRGELLALLWEDVDLKGGKAHLRGTATFPPRTVQLSEKAVAILKGLDAPYYRVFHISVAKLRFAFETACRSAGVEGVRFNELRHFAERVAKAADSANKQAVEATCSQDEARLR